MISVIGKQLIFPNEEQRFAFRDEEATSRTFVMKRYEADRIDLSPLTFRLDVEYKGGQKDTLLLTKAVEDMQMKLHWNVKTSGSTASSIGRSLNWQQDAMWAAAACAPFRERPTSMSWAFI